MHSSLPPYASPSVHLVASPTFFCHFAPALLLSKAAPVMRRSYVVTSLLILCSTTFSSPLQWSCAERNLPLSIWKSIKHTWARSLHWGSDDLEAPLTTKPNLLSNLEKRQTYNCTDLKAPFDSRCWDELNLSGYLLDPETGWNHTTRVCATEQTAEDNDGSDCCKVGEPWTTCYLRLAHGSPGQDCSQINSQFCSYQSTLDPYMDPSIKPSVQYVMKNIYGTLQRYSLE